MWVRFLPRAQYNGRMEWQDIVLSVGGYIFILALLPSILGDDKPALSSSLMTGSILGVFAAVYASLGLTSSAISTALLALAWLFLAWQKWRR